MQKKSLLIFIICSIFINFISAAYGSIQTFINRINPSTIIIGALFLIFFAFLNYVLSKIFRDKYGEPNRATAGIIAFCISVLIVYGLRNYLNNLQNLFYGFGISETMLWIIGIIAFIILSIFIIKWLKACGFLMILGAGLLIISFTELVYQKLFVGIVGAFFLILGILCFRKKPIRNVKRTSNLLSRALSPSPRRERSIIPKYYLKTEDYSKKLRELREKQRDDSYKRLEEEQKKHAKMARHLQKLFQQKQMELQKQQMLNAKGVKGAKKKIRTLESELIEIQRRMQKYS